MKRLFFILAAALLVTAASAQTLPKGRFFINPSLTNISFNTVTISVDGDKAGMNRFGLQASGGYAVIDNLGIVAGLGYQSASYQGSGLGAFNVFVGARYYIVQGFYAGANFAFGNLSTRNNDVKTSEVPKGSNNGTTLGIEANAGYSFFISDRFAIEPSLSFYYGLSNKMAGSAFNLNMFSVNFGFIYLL